jgi:hypothetical protein
MCMRGRLREPVIEVKGLREEGVQNRVSTSELRSHGTVLARARAREPLADLNVVRRLNESRPAASPGGRAVDHAVLEPLGCRFAGVGWSTRF